MINQETKTKISQYYKEMGREALFVSSPKKFVKEFLKGNRISIVCSENRLVRGLAKLRGLQYISPNQVEVLAYQYFALKDAFLLLAKKGVPVYFYNRVGMEKNRFVYKESAKKRIAEKLSFPVMYSDIKKYEHDFQELFGAKYSKDYVTEIGKIPQVIAKGDMYCHEDYKSAYINVVDGKRVTCYQPDQYKRTIHVYGRCGVFGYAVEDSDTMPSQLQKIFVDNALTDVRVVNHGLWGGTDDYLDHNFLKECAGMKQGDIVLFYRIHFDKMLLSHLIDGGVWYKEITHEWHQYDIARYGFYDKPGHMNMDGYKLVAQLIFKDMQAHNFKVKTVNPELLLNLNTAALNNYLKLSLDTKFQEEIDVYIDGIITNHPVSNVIEKCGSIVMNCNPFTRGHRYLIEYAAKSVDRLYIFVVEENHSFFNYEDRYKMVLKGTEDINNVIVVPSGKFIISSITFPEYFMKDYVKEKNFDVSMDLQVFCKYIAPPLKISVRFAGEEPFDPVTLNYNENMRRILPEYGMQFCEIPRMTLDGELVVNATEVRRLLCLKDFETIKKYVPDTTLSILMEHYT